MKDSPDIDAVVIRHVENQVRETLKCPDSKLRDAEFMREAQRSDVWRSANSCDRVCECIDELESDGASNRLLIVLDHGVDIGSGEGSQLHRSGGHGCQSVVSRRSRNVAK